MDDYLSTATGRPPLRALVVARQPIARAGLRGLLTETDGIVVVGHASSLEEAAAQAADLRPDVVMAGWEDGDSSELAALAEGVGGLGIPLVALGEAPTYAELGVLLRAGVRGFLLADASGDEVAATVDAVARGLLVLNPILASLLPAPTPTGLSDTGLAVEQLTDREREVLQLMALGLPNKAIARRLGITEHTVKFHVGSILAKLGAASRTEAVTRAARQGLLAL